MADQKYFMQKIREWYKSIRVIFPHFDILGIVRPALSSEPA